MIATSDPDVFIVERSAERVRYRRRDGGEWVVIGLCDQRGLCVVGAVVHGHQVRDLEDYRGLFELLGDRLGFRLDCPVTTDFKGCCPFRFEVG